MDEESEEQRRSNLESILTRVCLDHFARGIHGDFWLNDKNDESRAEVLTPSLPSLGLADVWRSLQLWLLSFPLWNVVPHGLIF